MSNYDLTYYDSYKKSGASELTKDDVTLKVPSTMMVFLNPTTRISGRPNLTPLSVFNFITTPPKNATSNVVDYVTIFHTLNLKLNTGINYSSQNGKLPNFIVTSEFNQYYISGKEYGPFHKSKLLDVFTSNFGGTLHGISYLNGLVVHATNTRLPVLFSKLNNNNSLHYIEKPFPRHDLINSNIKVDSPVYYNYFSAESTYLELKLPILTNVAKITSTAMTEFEYHMRTSLTKLNILLAEPGYRFQHINYSMNLGGNDSVSVEFIRDDNYGNRHRTIEAVVEKVQLEENTSFDYKYVFKYNNYVTLDTIYKDIIDVVSKDTNFLLYHAKTSSYVYLPFCDKIVGQSETDALVINSDFIEIVTETNGVVTFGSRFNKIDYAKVNTIKLDDNVSIIGDKFYADTLIFKSPYAMNAYMEIYYDGNLEKQPDKVIFKEAVTEIKEYVTKNGKIKLACWSLGKATHSTVYTANDIGRPETITEIINWVDYEKDILNLNSLRETNELMANSSINFTEHGVELALPEGDITADQAKMMLHMLSGTRLGLAATAKGGDQLISKIDKGQFTVYAPIFTVVKKPELTAEQKVNVDFFIDDTFAIRINPRYIPNPVKPNGQVTLRSTPFEGEQELIKKQIELKSLAQETVEALMKHPQFLSATTIAMALDK